MARPHHCQGCQRVPRTLFLLSSFREGLRGGGAPLHALTGKYLRFQWNDECQMAFDRLKAALTSSPILAMPTDGDVYVLDTDASEQSIGAVLSQKQGGEEKVIAYASRTYSRAEQNYCTTRKELLAVVYFMK